MEQVTAYPDSASSSPRSRSDSFDDPLYPSSQSSKLRLMCSYGGRIVPRPTDKSLCYLGGDTRILLLDRNSSLHDLVSKLVSLLNLTNFTLKYQLPNEDLDSLISLSSDEDLENMVDEYDRIASSGKSSSSRIRLFVFSGNLESAANSRGSIGSLLDDSKSETWFVDALNGTGIGVDGSSNLIGFDDGKVLDRDSSFGSTNSGLNLPPIRVRVNEDHRSIERNNLEEQFKKMNVYGSDDGRSDSRKQQMQQTVPQQGGNQQQQKFPPVDAPISDPRMVYYEERMPQPSIPINPEPTREIPVIDPPIPYRNQPVPVPATIPGSGYTLPTIPVQQPSQPQPQTQQQFVPINPQSFSSPQHSQPQSQPQFIPSNPQAQNQQQQQFVPVNPQTFSAQQPSQPQPQQQQQQFIPTNPPTQDGQFVAGNPQSIPAQKPQSQQFEPANPQTMPVNPQAQPQQQQFIPTNPPPQQQQQQHQYVPTNPQTISQPQNQQQQFIPNNPQPISHPQNQQQQFIPNNPQPISQPQNQQQQQQFIPNNPQPISQPQNQQQQFIPNNPQPISQPQNQQQQFVPVPNNPQSISQPQNQQQQQFIPANSQYVPMQSYYQVPIQQSHQVGQSHYVPQSQPFDPSMPMYYVPVRQNQQQPVSVQVPKGGAPKPELQPNMYRSAAPPSQMVHVAAPGGGYHVMHHPGQAQGNNNNNASAMYYTQAQTLPTQYQTVMSSDQGQQGQQQTMEMKQNRAS